MSVRNVIKAIKVKMMLNRLSKAKENAMREFLGLPPKLSWFEQCYTGCMTAIKDKLCQTFCPCCIYDTKRRLKRPSCWDSMFLRELLGFFGGAFLTVVLYLLLVYQIGSSPTDAFRISAVTGLVLSLLMAFSVNMRCFVLLMIPQLFSGKGRMFLLMYALFLVMNHPMKNFNANIMVMSESATCGQEMALNKTKELAKAAAAPMQSIMKSVKKVLKKVEEFGKSLKQVYVKCKKVVTEIGSALKRIADWLAGIVDRCNEEMGAPYKKCVAAFNYAEGECKKELFWPVSEGCAVVGLIGNICVVARIGELLCLITEAIKKVVESKFDLPVISVLDDAAKMFDFTVDISYDFNFTVVQSKSYKQIKADIQREISARLNVLIRFIKITELVMMLAILFIVVKACVYRTRYLCDDRYDNVYITYAVRDLDEKRKEAGKEGILPLNSDECGKYVQSNSTSMISSEKRKLVLGLFFFFISLFNAAFYLLCDVGLYYVLFIVAKHFSGDTGRMPTPPHTKLHVSGTGPMANMYKSIISMFDPIAETNVKVNTGACTPIPREPDWIMYDQIGTIYLFCLILTILESYGLRLRHLIMGCYFPKREKQRAAWLYNHIIKSRGGIIQNARKRMKGLKFGDVAVQHISWRGQLAASFPLLERLFKWCGWEVKSCLYCGREGKPDDYMNFIHCAYYDCDAVYCIDCFADLKNICAVCSNVVEYKGSDGSDEQDSSIDEIEKQKLTMQREYREGRIQQIQEARRPSKVLLGFKQMITEPDSSSDKHSNKVSEDSTDSEESRKSYQQSPMNNTNQNKYQLIEVRDDRMFLNTLELDSVNEDSEDFKHAVDLDETSCSSRDYNENSQDLTSNMMVNNYDSSSDTDSFVSSCSSVDSEELDYNYQFHKKIYERNAASFRHDLIDSDDEDEGIHKQMNRNIKIDELITRDMLSDSDTDISASEDDDSQLHELYEPKGISLHRA